MPAVMEATSVFEIERCAVDPPTVYTWLHQQVQLGEVLFPNSVCDHLKRIARDDGHPSMMWLSGARGLRQREDPLIEWHTLVIAKVPNLVDLEPPEGSAVAVLAMAYELMQNGEEALVVTEDIRDGLRMSLKTACQQMNVDCTEVRWWLRDNGHALI
jgi:hypothetical protein